MNFSQKFILTTCRPLLDILFSWKTEGKENIPPTGPLIVVANHVHVLDPIFLQFSSPRWINFVAKEELFRSPFLKPWLQWAGSFSIHRRGKIQEQQEVLNSARDALEQGLILGMFPEGSRAHDGKLRKGKTGSAVLATETNVPLLPVGIVGTDKIKDISWLWKRPAIVVNIGKPFKVAPIQGKAGRAQRQLITTQIMSEIARLLPPEYQGIYKEHEC